MLTRTKNTGKASLLAVLAGSTLIAAAAPIGLGQIKNCMGGTIDLSTLPGENRNFMRDFHVQRLGKRGNAAGGSAIETVEVWKIDDDGNETKINWPDSNNHGGTNRVSYGSDQNEAADQKIKWRVCFAGSKPDRVQVHITQDGNVNFNGWGQNIDVNKTLVAVEPQDSGSALILCNNSDSADFVLNVQVFMSPDPTIIDLPIELAIEASMPVAPDELNPAVFNPDGLWILPGDEFPLTLAPMPSEPGFVFIIVYEGFNEVSGVYGEHWQMLQLPEQEAEPCVGDLNGDGEINLQDLNILLSRFGLNC